MSAELILIFVKLIRGVAIYCLYQALLLPLVVVRDYDVISINIDERNPYVVIILSAICCAFHTSNNQR